MILLLVLFSIVGVFLLLLAFFVKGEKLDIRIGLGFFGILMFIIVGLFTGANIKSINKIKNFWEVAKTQNTIESYTNFLEFLNNEKNNKDDIVPKGYIKKSITNTHNKIIELGKEDSKNIIIIVGFLQNWDEGAAFSKDLKSIGWNPSSIADEIHLLIAKRDAYSLINRWPEVKQVLLKDVESGKYKTIENALYAFISLGKREIIPELIRKLNEYGNKTMAEAFLNCGLSELGDAAREWANRHGYTINFGEGAHPVNWGSFQ